MATRKIVNKHINQSSSTYVGQDGELFYDTVTNTLKISDGTTAGGVTVVTDGTGTSGITGVGTAGPVRVAGDYAVALGSFSAINTYDVNIGFGAGNAAAGYSINIGQETGKLAVDSYNTRIGFEAGKYGSSAGYGVAIGFQAGVTVVGTSSDAVVSGTSLNVGTGTGFAVGQYLNDHAGGSDIYFLPGTYIASGTSPNFVLSQAAQDNGTGDPDIWCQYSSADDQNFRRSWSFDGSQLPSPTELAATALVTNAVRSLSEVHGSRTRSVWVGDHQLKGGGCCGTVVAVLQTTD